MVTFFTLLITFDMMGDYFDNGVRRRDGRGSVEKECGDGRPLNLAWDAGYTQSWRWGEEGLIGTE